MKSSVCERLSTGFVLYGASDSVTLVVTSRKKFSNNSLISRFFYLKAVQRPCT